MTSRAGCRLGVVLLLGARSALAAEADPLEYRVDFSAGKVELDPELQTLKLEGDVEIRVGRYRLHSERLVLRRGPSGVEADGSGSVQLCPCDDSPVSLGFSSALVAPPTDLLVRQPTVRVYGVPVLWAPAIWLRAPNRPGLLLPNLAYRGEDGLLLSTGVHLPLGQDASVALRAGGYLQGGVDARVELSTRTTSTRVRFDHLRQSLATVDMRGYGRVAPSGAVTASVDSLRGARAARGVTEVEPPARRWDSARLDAATRAPPLTFGVGAVGLAPRGAALTAPWSWGPRLVLGADHPLGDAGELSAGAAVLSLSGGEGEQMVSLQRARLVVSPAVGVVRSEFEATQGSLVQQTDRRADSALWATLRARSGVALERRFAGGLRHRVEPLLEAVWRGGPPGPGSPIAPPSAAVFALAGVDSTLGRWSTGEGLTVRVRGGHAGAGERLQPWVGGRAVADFAQGALGLDGSAPLDGHDALHAQALARAGNERGWHLTSRLAGRRARSSATGRAVATQDWDGLELGALARAGWSLGVDAGLGWTRWLASSVTSDWDLQRREYVSLGKALGYRHPCDCLSAQAGVSRRIGRGGVDAVVTLDLLP
ncbi:MAG: hypothetical protein KF718_10455 [Polyangiaceae bacterium]|nr:hypothetical protein [Polyangiaceae bacterium]